MRCAPNTPSPDTMKNAKYRLFAFFFNLYRIFFKPDHHKVSFIMVHQSHFQGNLRYIWEELQERDQFQCTLIFKDEYRSGTIKSLLNLFLVKTRQLATSQYVFLNDNFLPLAFMNFHPEAEVVQLWHAAGAFKKFGLSAPTDPNLVELEKMIAQRLDYVVVSSQKVAPYYMEAFGVGKEKILPLGIPRTDYYFQEHDLDSLRNKFEKLYPASKNKKLVLYAPTFREDPELDKNLLNNLDIDLFQEKLGKEYLLAVRLHPQINQDQKLSPEVIDLTSYPDEKELLLLTDILITDYSSIMVEYTLLEKPVIFYPYDLEFYEFYERGFYQDYHEMVPGPIARSNQELIAIIKEDEYDFNRIREFKESQFDHADGKSSQRVVDHLIK